MLGPNRAEVQIHARRARAAIQGKGDRTVFAVHGVGGHHHFTAHFAIFVAHRQRTHGHRVVKRLAVELHRLIHMRFGRQRRKLVLGRFGLSGGLSTGLGFVWSGGGFVWSGSGFVGLCAGLRGWNQKAAKGAYQNQHPLADGEQRVNPHEIRYKAMSARQTVLSAGPPRRGPAGWQAEGRMIYPQDRHETEARDSYLHPCCGRPAAVAALAMFAHQCIAAVIAAAEPGYS